MLLGELIKLVRAESGSAEGVISEDEFLSLKCF
jgi:hypothetical protein